MTEEIGKQEIVSFRERLKEVGFSDLMTVVQQEQHEWEQGK